ncbi:hypothetical protein FHX08_004387 [Rhizobium sp. BK529]|uniref:hypothetical protein n=1 Tax=unclassified Rhizobium TaxID=2613769 RepID=UPI0010512B44|nr:MULTISPECIES: hypothetical protein [unclassified Rhizobium]MBB3593984.1 hypothetical protein [Rhizobium sp. BK529]TCS01440.1 hypothetical protein EV281_106185 [Rhizobium sp. BK418]
MRVLLISLLSLATITSATVPAMSADMIQGYERPPIVKHRSRPVVRTHYVERRRLDCSDMIVEYRYIPRTEVVTVCHRL